MSNFVSANSFNHGLLEVKLYEQRGTNNWSPIPRFAWSDIKIVVPWLLNKWFYKTIMDRPLWAQQRPAWPQMAITTCTVNK